jgi:hypothetical protein
MWRLARAGTRQQKRGSNKELVSQYSVRHRYPNEKCQQEAWLKTQSQPPATRYIPVHISPIPGLAAAPTPWPFPRSSPTPRFPHLSTPPTLVRRHLSSQTPETGTGGGSLQSRSWPPPGKPSALCSDKALPTICHQMNASTSVSTCRHRRVSPGRAAQGQKRQSPCSTCTCAYQQLRRQQSGSEVRHNSNSTLPFLCALLAIINSHACRRRENFSTGGMEYT